MLADLAHQLLSRHLKATPLPAGSLVKNPFGTISSLIGSLPRRTPEPCTPLLWEAHQEASTGLCWHTVRGSEGAELRDIISHLADEYEDVAPKSTKRHFVHRGEPSALGRNCALFDMVRFWAYDENQKDTGEIMKKAQELNQTLTPPLPFAEVQATSRSIGKFMASRYKPKTKEDTVNRGVMNLQASQISVKQKQKLAALRTADIKASNTEHRLKIALKHFPESRKLTQAALSEVSGVCLRTVKKHWKSIL